MLNAFSPGLGLGGQATGSLDFAQPARRQLPARRGAAQHRRLHPHRHRRPLGAGQHRPRRRSLRPEGGALGRGDPARRRVIGRVQARLQPLGPGAGAWTTRLLAAPLAGGIRYNGPADVPMSFANLPGHQLTGPIGIAADFSGRVQNPQFTGVVRANNLTYVNETYGTRITNLAVDGRFSGSQARDRLALRPRRRRHDRAAAARSASPRRPASRSTSGSNSRMPGWRAATISARSPPARSPSSTTAAAPRSPATLDLGEVRYQIVRQASAEVPQLAGVRRRGEPLPTAGRSRAGRCRRAEHLAARHPPRRRQPGLRLRHGPRIGMAARTCASRARRRPPRSSARSS